MIDDAGDMTKAGDKLVEEGAVEDSRTTAQGLFNYADGYLGSAHALSQAQVNVIFPDEPVRFLLYHAAELYLKAFLRCTGMSVNDLRLKGHRFTRLLPAVRSAGLELDKGVESVLRYGEQTGDVIDARHIKTGLRRYYDVATLGRCTARVRQAVRLHPSRRAGILLWGEGTGLVDDQWERAWGLDMPKPAQS